uniref:Secreted protein n=1 Tax=Chromera velia CCMP2878 TaxID=1169474 RepID=A0A0G4HKC0_9ALVE|eukprot:Cvel_28585.t1-p1 / transcript=Cvel_28585.t1 / gene=Cvel_28585 / organism=Chromera_velia_CCMP2878 / gene_product=hypothetical protein / transcript_product=hypothetical protein / location=Cvel_scaffold3768:10675-12887(-) / protein_length=126 / sequence_SO=supercontig / SO=protein_coding / is_pseudo=false
MIAGKKVWGFLSAAPVILRNLTALRLPLQLIINVSDGNRKTMETPGGEPKTAFDDWRRKRGGVRARFTARETIHGGRCKSARVPSPLLLLPRTFYLLLSVCTTAAAAEPDQAKSTYLSGFERQADG